MIPSLLTGLGGKLAERWATAIFTPAFAFWAFGAAVILLGRPDTSALGRRQATFTGLPGAVQAVVIVLALLVVAVSSVVAERLALAALRLLEGYWPTCMRRIANVLIARHAARLKASEQRWVELYSRQAQGQDSADKRRELIDVERRLSAMPAHPDRLMPTRLGNILRAAESGVEDKYGIDAVRCWTAMWLVLPEGTRAEITAARTSLDTAVTWLFWAVLTAVWTIFTPWALLVAGVASVVAYRNLPGTATRYGELIDAAFALHRGLLYDAVGRPRPARASDERMSGRALTTALWRGPELAAQLSTDAPDTVDQREGSTPTQLIGEPAALPDSQRRPAG